MTYITELFMKKDEFDKIDPKYRSIKNFINRSGKIRVGNILVTSAVNENNIRKHIMVIELLDHTFAPKLAKKGNAIRLVNKTKTINFIYDTMKKYGIEKSYVEYVVDKAIFFE